MKSLKEFDIEIFRLTNGKHEYEYAITDTFFTNIEGSFLEKGTLTVKMSLDKSDRLILTEFTINGTVGLVCDRSLDEYDYTINKYQQLVFKYGEQYEELSEDVISIPRDLQKLNVAPYIHEFISLAIPMKKLHPRYGNEENETTTEGKVVYSSENNPMKEEEAQTLDPRWNKLKDLKNKLK